MRESVQVCIGSRAALVGSLQYTRQGQREHSAFVYDESWLGGADGFNVSGDLVFGPEHQHRRGASSLESPFHGAIADTAPDAWGRRVIARDHARRRREDPSLGALTELDFLLAVDDEWRVGALRLRDARGHWRRSPPPGERSIPPLVELERMYRASNAIERGQESADDLRYLLGKGTSLGGARPKCSVRDVNGCLAVGKFPSQGDERSVTRGEVLALKLAARAGIVAAAARIVVIADVPVAVIRRFDREDAGRIPYQSAATLIQATREADHSYVEIADAIRSQSAMPTDDLRELWRRLVFNLLITNVDDHLRNHGFLHVGGGRWRLAPAFDLNPFPEKARESKTWLSEEDGPITDLEMLLGRADYFGLERSAAVEILGEVHAAVAGWRELAVGPEVGMKTSDLDAFAPAFEHCEMDAAASVLASGVPKPP